MGTFSATYADRGTVRPGRSDGRGRHGSRLDCGWVVAVDTGSISYAGPRAGFVVPPDVEVIDMRGRTVLPGLIDLHVHSTFLSDMQAYVENGVTTVRFAGIDQPSYRTVVSRTQDRANPSPRLPSRSVRCST